MLFFLVNYPFKVNNNEKSVKSDAVKRDFSKPFFFFFFCCSIEIFFFVCAMHHREAHRIHKHLIWDNPAYESMSIIFACVCVQERRNTGRERDRMQCISLNMGWKESEIERERERYQAQDPFNRGLSILFTSKHPQNTRTLFCLSSSKPLHLSLPLLCRTSPSLSL